MNQVIKNGLLEFNATNVTSFKEDLHISFRATPLSRPNTPREVSSMMSKPERLLPALAIMGANASGKSNVLKAMDWMRMFILGSFNATDPLGRITREPFLGTDKAKPSRFEIEMIIDGIWYRYGFEVNDEVVLKEYAHWAPKGRKVLLFNRDGQDVILGSRNRPIWRVASTLMRENALLLSAGAFQKGNSDARKLYNWFRNNLLLADDETSIFRREYTSRMSKDAQRQHVIKELLHAADLGLSDLKIMENLLEENSSSAPKASGALSDSDDNFDDEPEIIYVHTLDGKEYEFDEALESKGTLAWVSLIGPVFDVLVEGGILLVDELGDRLHPSLVQQIINLFQRPETNPNFGQIIFNTHSLAILGDLDGERLLGRDQIFFTEKDFSGSSRIFRLSESAPRNDEAIPKRYMDGIYGGVPILDFQRYVAALERIEK
jgi:hypothetical protein